MKKNYLFTVVIVYLRVFFHNMKPLRHTHGVWRKEKHIAVTNHGAATSGHSIFVCQSITIMCCTSRYLTCLVCGTSEGEMIGFCCQLAYTGAGVVAVLRGSSGGYGWAALCEAGRIGVE